MTGTLTLRGVSQEVTLEVTLNQVKRYPLPPFRRTAGFSATTTLSRRAFGITAWPGVIGDAVQVRIEAEATLDRSDSPGTPAPQPHSDNQTAPKDPS
ncbi:YceI-like domain protein [compost metagenome]